MKKILHKFFPLIIFFIIILILIFCLWYKQFTIEQHNALQIIPVQISDAAGTPVDFEGTIYYKANDIFYLSLKNNTGTCYIRGDNTGRLYRFYKNSWEQISDRGVLSHLIGYALDFGQTGKITAPGIAGMDLKTGMYKLTFPLQDDAEKKSVEFFTEFKLK